MLVPVERKKKSEIFCWNTENVSVFIETDKEPSEF